MTPNGPKDLRTALECNATDHHWHAYLNCLREWQESDVSFDEYAWDDKMDLHARICIDLYFSGPEETNEKQMERASAFRDDAVRRLRTLKKVGLHPLHSTPNTNDDASHHRSTESPGSLRAFHRSIGRNGKQSLPKRGPRATSTVFFLVDPFSSSSSSSSFSL